MEKINNIDYSFIQNNKFKTNTISVFFKEKVKKEDILKRQCLPKILLDRTKNYDSRFKLTRKLASLYSASLSVKESVVGEYSMLTFSVTYIHSKYLDEDITNDVIEFLYEVIYNPYTINNQFDESTILRLQNELKNLIKRKEESFAIKSKEQALETAYKDQSITYRIIKEDEVNKVNNSEVYDYYQKILLTNEMLIVVEGHEDVRDKLSMFNTNEASKMDYQPPLIKSNNHGLVIKKDKTKQNNIVMIFDNLDCSNEANSKNFMFSMMLGETPNSLLFQEVREKHSLAYSIGSSYDPFYKILSIIGGVKLDSLDETLTIINDIFTTFKTADLTQLLEDTRKSYLNTLYSNLDSKLYLTIRTLREWVQKSIFSIDETINLINSVTVEDIKKIANTIENKIIYVLQGESNEAK